MRLVLPFRLAPDTLAAPVPGPQHFLMNILRSESPSRFSAIAIRSKTLRVAFCRRPSSWAM